MNEFKTLYLCDPEKNVKCNKQECYTGNGLCYATSNKDYALYVEGVPIIVMTKGDQESCLKNGQGLIAQLEIATKAVIKRYDLYLKSGSGGGLLVRESTGKNGKKKHNVI